MWCTNTRTVAELVICSFHYSSGLLLQAFPTCLFSDLLIQEVENDGRAGVRLKRGKKLGKQSYVSESQTNNLSAGELCLCSFVFMKLNMNCLKFNFYFICFFTNKPSNWESKAIWWWRDRAETQNVPIPAGVRHCSGHFTHASAQPCVRCNPHFPCGIGLIFYFCKASLSQGLRLINVQGAK